MARRPTPSDPKAAKARLFAWWLVFLVGAALFGPLGHCVMSDPRGLACVLFLSGLSGMSWTVLRIGWSRGPTVASGPTT
jgi:hypothetical protein